MLNLTTRTVLIVTAILASSAFASVGPAAADPRPPKPGPNYEWKCFGSLDECAWVASNVMGEDGSTETNPAKQPGKKVKQVCQFGGAAQACTSDFGNWSNSQQCYMQRWEPQPPPGDPRWEGHTDGSVWACVRQQGYDDGEHLVTRWVWLPGAPDTVVTDPLTLAYRAVATMNFKPPLVRSAPGVGQVGLVNMPVWLWVVKSENTYGPIVREASVPGLTVTARAQVRAINWNMGDGKTIRCEGAGTAYSKAMGVKDSPDCGHRYRKTSREQADCKYKVTATAEWDITWQSTLGDTGQIAMTQQAATQMQIGEAIPVLVDPDGDRVSQPSQSAGC
ncbi:hypothetical protein ACFPJ1_26535 [Kribbella qitaiheensis]|uniref:hypothetical protein n=1 Tax=Kribbella qitaiheensis TaxID=1544730 RepID=UPI00361F17B3